VVPGEPGTLTAGTEGQGVQQSLKMLIMRYFNDTVEKCIV
jgi:hypothetical protein